jgi:serine/threonine protein kinase
MSKQEGSNQDDPALEILAGYIEESDRLTAGSAELESLRARYLRNHPDERGMLIEHFEAEDQLRTNIGVRTALPQLERYAEIEPLGRGGMGVVYKAFDRTLKRWVALKLCASYAMSDQDRSRFRIEAESMAAMKHPNIVKVFDVLEHEGTPYLTMEFIQGGSLEQQLDRYRGDHSAIARLMVDISRGVHHAHQRQILHRDLKPSNILLHVEADGSTRAHVVDFGLAKPFDLAETALSSGVAPGDASIAYGRMVGTASYMSPEQARGEPATTQTDIYGLGSIMYALLTGHPPLRGASVEETIEQVRDPNVSPKPPSQIFAAVDPTLEAICLKCLEYEPSNRYAAAEGVALDLERWLDRRPTVARPLNPRARLTLWARRNPLALGIVVMLFALMGLAVIAVYDEMQEIETTLVNVAETHADSVRNWLGRQRELISAWATREDLGALVVADDVDELQRLVLEWEDDTNDGVHTSPYQSIFVVDAESGSLLARSPYLDPRDDGYDFVQRDYYAGAVHLATQPGDSPAYRSRVYFSISENLYKFAVSAAIWHEERIVGVVAASVTTSPNLGGLLPLAEDGNSAFVLFAARDENVVQGESNTRPQSAGNLLTLAHPLLEAGSDPFWLEASEETEFLSSECHRNFRDPAAASRPEQAGPWTACWAPVDGTATETELLVTYQQRARGLGPGLWLFLLFALAAIPITLAMQFLSRAVQNRG